MKNKPVFNGRVYGSFGFTKDDGEGVCFSFNEIEQKVLEKYPYNSKGNRRELKRYLYVRDDRICKYCEVPLSYKEATIDHFFPPEAYHISEKMLYNRGTNLVLCCYPCNFFKGKKMPENFKVYDRTDRRLRIIIKRFILRTITNIKLTLNGTKTLTGKHKGIEMYKKMNKTEREEAKDARFRQSY